MLNSGLKEKFKGIASTKIGIGKRKRPLNSAPMSKNSRTSLGVLNSAGRRNPGSTKTTAMIEKLSSALKAKRK